jgi:hypothetical protein
MGTLDDPYPSRTVDSTNTHSVAGLNLVFCEMLVGRGVDGDTGTTSVFSLVVGDGGRSLDIELFKMVD